MGSPNISSGAAPNAQPMAGDSVVLALQQLSSFGGFDFFMRYRFQTGVETFRRRLSPAGDA